MLYLMPNDNFDINYSCIVLDLTVGASFNFKFDGITYCCCNYLYQP